VVELLVELHELIWGEEGLPLLTGVAKVGPFCPERCAGGRSVGSWCKKRGGRRGSSGGTAGGKQSKEKDSNATGRPWCGPETIAKSGVDVKDVQQPDRSSSTPDTGRENSSLQPLILANSSIALAAGRQVPSHAIVTAFSSHSSAKDSYLLPQQPMERPSL
jgi:hypothetical protein